MKNLKDKSKEARAKPPTQVERVQFTDDQIREVQEAIKISERAMTEWVKKSRVDPQKMREPLSW